MLTKDLRRVQRTWEYFACKDPFWAVLMDPDKIGNKWDKEEFFRRGEEEITSILAYIEYLNLPLVLGRALDFGCGVGRLSQALADHFDECVGIDIAPTMVVRARELNRKDQSASSC